MMRSILHMIGGLAMLTLLSTAPVSARAQTADDANAQIGALAPENLKKPRPKAPFDLTGTWFIDLSKGIMNYRFGPPYPKFKPAAQASLDAAIEAAKNHISYKDEIGKCWPAGMPMIMTRVWPIATVQLPTVIYMVSGFENSLRIIYLDGRPHTDPDLVVRSFDGESIGHWEGDTLVVDTTAMTVKHHLLDDMGIPVGDKFHIVERIKMEADGTAFDIDYTLTDPDNWDGEWKSSKRWKRQDHNDITEVECLPDLDEHLPSTHSKSNIN